MLEAVPRSRAAGRSLTSKERWERTNEALKRFKLDAVRKNSAGRCSGGEKRRLEIARCLVCEPLLILLDEPTNDLHIETLQHLEEPLEELADCSDVISHDRWFQHRRHPHLRAFSGLRHG